MGFQCVWCNLWLRKFLNLLIVKIWDGAVKRFSFLLYSFTLYGTSHIYHNVPHFYILCRKSPIYRAMKNALVRTMQSQNFKKLWPFWNRIQIKVRPDFLIQAHFVLIVDIIENLQYQHWAETCSLIQIMFFQNFSF